MAYRNGTYIAFHAEGKTDPTASDIRYYRLMKAWHEAEGIDFRFVNSHEKVQAVKDSASKARIKDSLERRLDESKNMVLIIGPRTRNDTDFVPHEIAYAVDTCCIPVIAVYTEYSSILRPGTHSNEWPAALRKRIEDGSAHVIHIPFKRELILQAIKQFDLNNLPAGGYVHYTKEFQEKMGIHF
jgi:hypothetical protein